MSIFFFCSLFPPPPRSPLFPYTTLFRSFMPADSAVPHFTVDSVCAGPHMAYHLDLIPRMDLGSRITYLNEVFQRSQEHTSELQSRENLVCRLLLEKKKNIFL